MAGETLPASISSETNAGVAARYDEKNIGGGERLSDFNPQSTLTLERRFRAKWTDVPRSNSLALLFGCSLLLIRTRPQRM